MPLTIETLLDEIHKDISFSDEDKRKLEMSCKTFLIGQLKEIEEILSNKMEEFCKDEIEKMKEIKKDRFNENVNKATEHAVRQIATKFDLNETEVLEHNKCNLLEIKNYHELCSSEKTKPLVSPNPSPKKESPKIIQNKPKDSESTDTKTSKSNTIKKVPICSPDISDKEAYKGFLISKNKCPAIKKDGKFCEKPKKFGHFCGFHKE
tara:strand:- start:1167 stop:1787 length:621 start_codon:yes stop_codon:yes gene_type:complete